MVILTEGLRGLAGDALRRLLARSTTTPLRGAATGALTTALIQSSSATTVTAISFVGAGLLTFPQALGIVFGANIGTTITGWMVAIIGFKLKLGTAALPLIFIGVLIRLFARGRLRQFGWAMAGFGLLFFGIDAMKQGMVQFEGLVTPEDFPADTLTGRLQLLLIGIGITLVTQSSSAGVAISLVALAAGSISFAQGAAMVIGMNIGTTFTAALATIGGSTASRQTGYGQVVYNVLTGIMAFFLLGPFTSVADQFIAAGGPGNAQIALVSFHTLFNTLGVILVLPLAGPFARLIVRLVPERGPPLLRNLDDRLLRDPASAVTAAAATVHDIAARLMDILSELLAGTSRSGRIETGLTSVGEALETTRAYLGRIRTEPTQQSQHSRHLAAVHALDHLIRLAHRCGQTARIDMLHKDPELRELAALLRDAADDFPEQDDLEAAERQLDGLRARLRRQHYEYRESTVEKAAQQLVSADATLLRLDAIRWLHRVTYHYWRIVHHLRRTGEKVPVTAESLDVESIIEEDL